MVHGIGINNKGIYKCFDYSSGKKVPTTEYLAWKGCISRCYSKWCQKRQPQYVGCTVDESFRWFQHFAEWCNKQVGFGNKGWHLDKDIILKGNKVYSENTCCFVPHEINVLFTNSKVARGDCPIGVSFNKREGKYKVSCRRESKLTHLGYYNTKDEAFLAYKTFKESVIKEAANKWKDSIDPRAYTALMNYQVEITD